MTCALTGEGRSILRRLRVELRAAERRAAARLPSCVRTPCNAALRRATLPAALETEILRRRHLTKRADMYELSRDLFRALCPARSIRVINAR